MGAALGFFLEADPIARDKLQQKPVGETSEHLQERAPFRRRSPVSKLGPVHTTQTSGNPNREIRGLTLAGCPGVPNQTAENSEVENQVNFCPCRAARITNAIHAPHGCDFVELSVWQRDAVGSMNIFVTHCDA